MRQEGKQQMVLGGSWITPMCWLRSYFLKCSSSDSIYIMDWICDKPLQGWFGVKSYSKKLLRPLGSSWCFTQWNSWKTHSIYSQIYQTRKDYKKKSSDPFIQTDLKLYKMPREVTSKFRCFSKLVAGLCRLNNRRMDFSNFLSRLGWHQEDTTPGDSGHGWGRPEPKNLWPGHWS